MRRFLLPPLLFALLSLPAFPALSEIRRDPTGVNVNSQGPTTVFISFGGLNGQVPVEATWCGEVIPAAPDIGFKCDPRTIYGSLPVRYDQSSLQGGAFTDIMTIPTTVAMRAYQAAERGALSPFFYVRRFVSQRGGPDEYVIVTCRPSAGGARTPLSLVDVKVAFDVDQPVLSVRVGDVPPSLKADIQYTGTGRLVGRWEVVFPGDELPTETDLLTEATLPADQRAFQRRYTEIERFNLFLPPTGRVTLKGPDPKRIPTRSEGLHLILLRIEATNEKEGDSNLANAGAGVGVVHSGGVAGFPMPPLRFWVGSTPPELLPGGKGGLTLLSPANRALVAPDAPVVFKWTPVSATSYYLLQVRGGENALLHEAFVGTGTASYAAPPWLAAKAGDAILRWSVRAIGPEGQDLAASGAAELRFELKKEKEGEKP